MIRLEFSLCFLINVYSFENTSTPCAWFNKSGSKPQKYFSSKGTCSLWHTVNVLKTETATIIHHWNLCSLFQSLKTRGFEVQILFQKETKKVAKLCIASTSVVEIHQTTNIWHYWNSTLLGIVLLLSCHLCFWKLQMVLIWSVQTCYLPVLLNTQSKK